VCLQSIISNLFTGVWLKSFCSTENVLFGNSGELSAIGVLGTKGKEKAAGDFNFGFHVNSHVNLSLRKWNSWMLLNG